MVGESHQAWMRGVLVMGLFPFDKKRPGTNMVTGSFIRHRTPGYEYDVVSLVLMTDTRGDQDSVGVGRASRNGEGGPEQ
jgi:hypothetical protein